MLKSKDKSPSVEVEHHDVKTKNFIVIFDFHHCCLQIYNIKTHEVLTTNITTKHAKEGGKYKTYLEEYYVGGFPLENYPPVKGGKGVLDDIPEKPIKEEIMEFFKSSIPMIELHVDDVRHLIIVCEFKHFPLRRYFNSTMKKFESYSKVPLKFMTQVSAAYLPYFYDSGNFDSLRRNRYCLIFRQTNKRIDAILFKNIKNRLKVINSIHRVIDNTGLNEDELIEILETIRTVKNVIEDCDFYIFELKKRGIENIFTQIIDTEKPVKFLPFDESRFELNKQFYERMGLDLDDIAEREEEFLKLSQIGKYAPQTMQGSNTTSHHLSEDQKLEDKCKFPLRRPPPLPGRMENTDPYGETSISPLQWNRSFELQNFFQKIKFL
uniref:Uncharacterized protein n=1 Tax=Panagrolaimus superbus TaxID=310955 RepID=A0A914YPA7_9BILA